MEILENAGQAGNKIMGSLKSIISDAEKVLENSTQHGSESYQNAKRKLESTITDAKFVLRELEEVVVNKAKDAAAQASSASGYVEAAKYEKAAKNSAAE